MKVYNTLSKQKEEFVPLQEGKVSMYVCGPTVYNLIHIGYARPMIVFDTVRRYLEHKGYEVNYVSNFTDVDDKIIAKANEEGVTAKEISERYIAECKKDMAGMYCGNRKKKASRPGRLRGATDVLDGISSVPLWRKNIWAKRLIFMQVERIWYSHITRMRLHRVNAATARSFPDTGCTMRS